MLPIRQLLLVALLAALGFALPGCGPSYPETVPVSGTVTLNGQAVAGAAIVFTPEEGNQATGTTDASGRFELSTFQLGDGALPGKHRVTVVKATVEQGTEEKVVFLVPQKFGNLKTTELTCDVQKEMGPVSFDLQGESDPVQKPTPAPAEVTDPPENGESLS